MEKTLKLELLLDRVRYHWAKACMFDQIEPENRVTVWSEGNPHRKEYMDAVNEYNKARGQENG